MTNTNTDDLPPITPARITDPTLLSDAEIISVLRNEIDGYTEDLLDVADILEAHRINVDLGNGRFLNPAWAIRGKVDHIWDAVLDLARIARGGRQ